METKKEIQGIERYIDTCANVIYEIEVPLNWKEDPYYKEIADKIWNSSVECQFSIRNKSEWNKRLRKMETIAKFFRIEGDYYNVLILVEDYLGFNNFAEKFEVVEYC